jgi:hypothetical protein
VSALGLDPEGETDTIMTQATVSYSTVATWIKDLNPKQLRAVAEKCDTSQNPRRRRGSTGVVGRGGVADPHGRTGRSGVNFNRPVSGRPRGIKFACVCPSVSGRHRQNGEASGLVPEVLHAQPRPGIDVGGPHPIRPCAMPGAKSRLRRFRSQPYTRPPANAVRNRYHAVSG